MAQNPNPSLLDPGQIIKRAFNEANDTVRVEGSISVAELAVDEIGQPIGTEIKLAGGVDSLGNARALSTDINGELQVDILSSALPSGAATEVKQDTGNTSLASIDTKTPALVSGRVPVDGSGVTQPVSAVSLPLPTGAATEAKQDTANTSLASIDSKLTSPLSVTGPLTDVELRATPVAVSGPLTDTQLRASAVPVSAASLPLPTGAATEVTLASVDSKTPALVSGRVPVDGSGVTQPVSGTVGISGSVAVTGPLTNTELRAAAVPVSAASLPLPTGAATEATLLSFSNKTNAGLVGNAHDYIEQTYVTAGNGIGQLETVVFKTGGALGTTVATLSFAYDGQDRLVSVTRT